MKPTISIITRTKDRPVLLRRAIASVQNQEGDLNWEHIIVNDAGDPEPVRKLISEQPEFYRKKVRTIHLKASEGMENASNQGIEQSNGDFIIIHDDDDSWAPNCLKKLADKLDGLDPEYAGVACHSIRVVENLDENKVEIIDEHPFNADLESIELGRMLQENCFPPISFLFRRKVYDEVGPFDIRLPVLGDWEFNLRILLKYKIALLPELLANYHHRTSKENPAYANSITFGHDNHQVWDEKLRKRWEKEGLGNQGPEFGQLARAMRAIFLADRSLDRIESRIMSLPTPVPPQQ